MHSKRAVIYFLWAEKANTIKIGFTKNIRERLSHHQRGASEVLRVLRVVDGTMTDEKRLHRRFAKYRVHGEWYTVNPELLDYIDFLGPRIKNINYVKK